MTPRPALLIAMLALGACANPPPVPPAAPAADAIAVAGVNSGPIGFAGFGPATFGANEEAVRIAWGPPGLKGGGPEPGATCHHLSMDPPPPGARGIRVAHAGRLEERPHKYVVGALELTVRPADGGTARLVIEGDTTGRIASWRIGVPPQVFYVEGCG